MVFLHASIANLPSLVREEWKEEGTSDTLLSLQRIASEDGPETPASVEHSFGGSKEVRISDISSVLFL